MKPTSQLTPLIVCTLLLAASLHTKAQSKPCGDYDTQSEMNLCAANEAKKADQLLNTTYRQLLTKLKDNKIASQKLIAAQRAWVAFRDADLAAQWPVGLGENPQVLYGSVHPFCYSEALAAMTNERTRELQTLMTHEEGDVCSANLAKCTAKPSNPTPAGY